VRRSLCKILKKRIAPRGTDLGRAQRVNSVSRFRAKHAGNLATIGASAARALQLVCGTNDVPVAVTWSLPGGLPGVTRHFDGFWQAAEEEAMARIYGGIHYRFDQQAGQQVGLSVAEFVFANFVRPRSR
jgi:hypothetical protein